MYLLKHDLSSRYKHHPYYSHSTMYLLKHLHHLQFFVSVVLFTFHHVSIKTGTSVDTSLPNAKFTFHHVSIKTHLSTFEYVFRCDSHSTMYLLKHQLLPKNSQNICYSHSTMYLLKPFVFFKNKFLSFIHIPPCIY